MGADTNQVTVGLEIGRKRVFASALDWPGWCRSGKDEAQAIETLWNYGPRYQVILERSELEFQVPQSAGDFVVIERLPGGATTDFGAPEAVFASEKLPVSQADLPRLKRILQACWQAFDRAVQGAAGKELRKGPRGGGREADAISDHVLNADLAYLSRLGRNLKIEKRTTTSQAFAQTRQAILEALEAAACGDLPERGPRGGVIWPARYYVRRSAWHVLDHAWEMEDRM